MKRFLSRVFSMHPLAIIAGACLIALTIPSYRLMEAERANVGAIPRELDKQAAVIEAQVSRVLDGNPLATNRLDRYSLRTLLVGEVDKQAGAVIAQVTATRRDLDSQVTAISGRLFGEADQFRDMANARIGDTLARADTALGEIHELHGQVSPIIASTADITSHAAGITEHADEASAILLRRDALPAQVLGVLGATKVTLGEAAETMKSVKEAAPKISNAAVGIADDAKREADSIATPKHWYEKLSAEVYAVARIISLFF